MKRGLIGVILVLCMSHVVYAADGPYFSGHLGATVLMDSTFSDTVIPGSTAEAEFDTGLVAAAAVGYKTGMMRLEGEFSYRSNGLDKVTDLGGPFSASGDVTAFSGMLNGYVDLDNQTAITPFLMAGIGFSNISLDGVVIDGFPFFDEDDTVFAYQGGAGVGIALAPNLMLDVEYRYFATTDPEFSDNFLEAEYGTHNFMAGVRVSF